MFYGTDAFGTLWYFCKSVLFLAVAIVAALIGVAAIVFVFAYPLGDDASQDAPLYDASCTEIAMVAQRRCNNASHDDPAACTGLFDQAYKACRQDVSDGHSVLLLDNRFVPADDRPELPCDCTASVAIAIAATAQRCSQVLDCKNVDRHPNDCSDDCKYHTLEAALGPGEDP